MKRVALKRRKGAPYVCDGCGEEFYRPPSQMVGIKNYCSRPCRSKNPPDNRRSPEATKRMAESFQRDRLGEGNPNFKHGKRAGVGNRERKQRFQSGQRYCQHPECKGWKGKPARAVNQHHVVYEQHVRKAGGDIFDPRNALGLCWSCHQRHHRRGAVLPVSALRPENLAFAAELLGEAVVDYFPRYYVCDAPGRLEEALRAS